MTVVDLDEAFAHEVHDELTGLGEGDTRVVDAAVRIFFDVTDSQALRVTLVLPRPEGSSWDVDKTIELKREARRLTDEIAWQHDLDLDGTTLVLLTTNDTRPEDVAVEDEPEPAERLDATDEESGEV